MRQMLNMFLSFRLEKLKIVGPKMIPFVKAVSLYYILDTYNHHGELWTTFFKCAPIACLIMFIVLYEGGKISKP